jgi:hypothetical protein
MLPATDLAALRAEALRLADHLLAAAHSDAHGLYWAAPPTAEAPVPLVDESLFAGSTGIALFFVALAGYTGQPAHRAAAEASTRWLVAHAQRVAPANVSFFSGRTGVVYLCIKLFELTGQAKHRRWATIVAQAIRPHLLRGNGSPDLLGGDAGNLLVVAHLYQLTGRRSWLPVLAAGLRRLVRYARPGRQGLKWNYHPASLDSPTGLSHGASGIAHALLELSRSLGASPALRWLAGQALRYEAQYYRPAPGTWLSLRTHAACPTNPATLRLAPARLLLGGGTLAGWAHGVAGFTLVRLRAAALKLSSDYQQEAAAGLRRVRHYLARRPPPHADYTLCAGLGGLAEVLLVAAGPPPLQAQALAQARQLAQAAVAQRQALGYYAAPGGQGHAGDDLLTGQAGLGYLLLRVLAPDKTASVLLPQLPPPGRLVPAGRWPWELPLAALRRQVWGPHFRRTLHLLAQVLPQGGTEAFADAAFPLETHELDALQSQLRQLGQQVPLPARSVVAEVFRLERRRLALLRQPEGVVYREARQHALAAWVQVPANVDPAALLLTPLQVSPQVRLLATRWHWTSHQPARWLRNLTARPGTHTTLLHLAGEVVREYPVPPLAAAVLRSLRRPATGAQLAAQLGAGLPGQAAQAAIVAQLLALLQAGFVLPLALLGRRAGPKTEVAGGPSPPATSLATPAK